jgi:hypothetical protein
MVGIDNGLPNWTVEPLFCHARQMQSWSHGCRRLNNSSLRRADLVRSLRFMNLRERFFEFIRNASASLAACSGFGRSRRTDSFARTLELVIAAMRLVNGDNHNDRGQ